MLYSEIATEEWYAFLHDMQSEDIVWRCPWLNLPAMAINSASFQRMVIASLVSFTFYIPGRTLHQFGMSQGLHKARVETFQPPDFNARILHNYQCSRNDKVLEGPLSSFVTWLDSRYVKWLHKEVMARSGGHY